MDSRQFEYRRAMDALRYTDGQKALLARLVTDRAERRTAPARRRSLRRAAVIAACAAVLLTAGAGAAGGLKSAAEAFASIFGGTPAQTEVVDRIGYPVGASDSADGVTITADAVIGDKYNACVVYSIRRNDGEPFEYDGLNDYGNGNLNLCFGKQTTDTGWQGGTGGSSWFFDQVPGDDAVQYVELFSASGAAFAGDVTVRSSFENLCVRMPDEKTVPIAEGKWKLAFQANLEDCALTLGGGETFEQGGLTFTVNEISLSPVGVMVRYTADSAVRWSDAPSGRVPDQDRREVERYMENVEILVTRTDGTVVDLSAAGGSLSPKDGVTECSKGGFFVSADPTQSILPLSEIASVSVGGVVYEVPTSL